MRQERHEDKRQGKMTGKITGSKLRKLDETMEALYAKARFRRRRVNNTCDNQT